MSFQYLTNIPLAEARRTYFQGLQAGRFQAGTERIPFRRALNQSPSLMLLGGSPHGRSTPPSAPPTTPPALWMASLWPPA